MCLHWDFLASRKNSRSSHEQDKSHSITCYSKDKKNRKKKRNFNPSMFNRIIFKYSLRISLNNIVFQTFIKALKIKISMGFWLLEDIGENKKLFG